MRVFARIIAAWRVRFRGQTVVQGIAKDELGEVFFETWAGSWVERERGGLAIAGILREAGLPEEQIRKLLQDALASLDTNEDAT